MKETTHQPIPREARVPLEVAVQFAGHHGPNTGQTLNVSSRGMFVRTNKPGVVGEHIFFQIQPDEDTPIRFNLEGVVVWIRKRASQQTGVPKGMGIRFAEGPTQDANTVQRIFSALIS